MYKKVQKLNTKNPINKHASELNRRLLVQMANKYMKKCSTPLATKEMQIKMTLRFISPIRMAIVNNTKRNVEENVGKRNPYTFLVRLQIAIVLTTLEISLEVH
jgi:hypothetical protein